MTSSPGSRRLPKPEVGQETRRPRALASRVAAVCLATATLWPGVARAEVVAFQPHELVASVTTRGQYDLKGLTFWNGQPLSATNRPTFDECQLSVSWNFYVRSDAPHVLYVQATSVRDTTFGYLSGAPFNSVALTRFRFQFDTDWPHVPPARATFSNDLANPNQFRVGDIDGIGGSRRMDDIRGWSFRNDDGWYDLSADSIDFGMSHFGTVTGGSRILGGGLFSFAMPQRTDIRRELDFSLLVAQAYHGRDEYLAPAVSILVPVQAVPQPATLGLALAGLLLVLTAAARSRRVPAP